MILVNFQVFACVGAIQALTGLLSPVYQLIYHQTYQWHVGFVYCISCTILSLMLTLTFYVYVYLKNHEKKLKVAMEQNDQTDSGGVPLDILKLPSFKKLEDDDL